MGCESARLSYSPSHDAHQRGTVRFEVRTTFDCLIVFMSRPSFPAGRTTRRSALIVSGSGAGLRV
jgi:hypothetical protein